MALPIATARIENILRTLVAASHGDYDVPVPLEEIDDAFLEVEIGVNYLLDELIERREQNEAQRQQIAGQTAELLEALSTPIIVVWPGVLTLPLVGRLDLGRATLINTRLLDRVVSESATHVILDLTGVETIETSTVSALLRMIGAIGLLGARCFVTGIGSRGAQQIVELGADSKQLRSFARVSDALALVLAEKSRGTNHALPIR
jgi:rsbT co-antagonist protein RsbR